LSSPKAEKEMEFAFTGFQQAGAGEGNRE